MSPTRCGGGGGLLLLQRIRLQGAVVVRIHHLLLHVSPVVVLDHGVVLVALLLDLMLNVKNKSLTEYRYKKKSSWIREFSMFLEPDPKQSVISFHKIITERYLGEFSMTNHSTDPNQRYLARIQ